MDPSVPKIVLDDLNVGKFRSTHQKAILNIMYTGHWLTAGIDRVLRPLGLSEPQFNVLTLVYAAHGEAVSASDIRAGMVQAESNVTRIVDRLVDRGLMTRETCPENRRKVDIRITDEGKKVFREAKSMVFDIHRRIGDRLTDGELEMVSDALDILRNGEIGSAASHEQRKQPGKEEASTG